MTDQKINDLPVPDEIGDGVVGGATAYTQTQVVAPKITDITDGTSNTLLVAEKVGR